MLGKDFYTELRLEFTNETRIPEGEDRENSTNQYTLKTYHNSLAIPRSLQHLMRALLLHASVAVGIPEGSKYSCSPRAMATNLRGDCKIRVQVL